MAIPKQTFGSVSRPVNPQQISNPEQRTSKLEVISKDKIIRGLNSLAEWRSKSLDFAKDQVTALFNLKAQDRANIDEIAVNRTCFNMRNSMYSENKTSSVREEVETKKFSGIAVKNEVICGEYSHCSTIPLSSSKKDTVATVEYLELGGKKHKASVAVAVTNVMNKDVDAVISVSKNKHVVDLSEDNSGIIKIKDEKHEFKTKAYRDTYERVSPDLFSITTNMSDLSPNKHSSVVRDVLILTSDSINQDTPFEMKAPAILSAAKVIYHAITTGGECKFMLTGTQDEVVAIASIIQCWMELDADNVDFSSSDRVRGRMEGSIILEKLQHTGCNEKTREQAFKICQLVDLAVKLKEEEESVLGEISQASVITWEQVRNECGKIDEKRSLRSGVVPQLNPNQLESFLKQCEQTIDSKLLPKLNQTSLKQQKSLCERLDHTTVSLKSLVDQQVVITQDQRKKASYILAGLEKVKMDIKTQNFMLKAALVNLSLCKDIPFENIEDINFHPHFTQFPNANKPLVDENLEQVKTILNNPGEKDPEKAKELFFNLVAMRESAYHSEALIHYLSMNLPHIPGLKLVSKVAEEADHGKTSEKDLKVFQTINSLIVALSDIVNQPIYDDIRGGGGAAEIYQGLDLLSLENNPAEPIYQDLNDATTYQRLNQSTRSDGTTRNIARRPSNTASIASASHVYGNLPRAQYLSLLADDPVEDPYLKATSTTAATHDDDPNQIYENLRR